MKRYRVSLGVALALALAVCAFPSAGYGQDAVDAALKAVREYEFGKSRECLTTVSDAVREASASPKQRKAIEAKLLDVLAGPATADAKDFVCRQLSLIASEASVPALRDMIGDDVRMADMGRYALERIPGPAADDALLAALGKTSGGIKIGVINSLGVRKCAKAVPAVAALAGDSDAGIAAAALAALGKIANKEATAALAKAKGAVPASLQASWADAYLMCADQRSADGDKSGALKIYEELDGDALPRIQVASFLGRVKAMGEKGVPIAVEALTGQNADLQSAALMCVRKMEGKEATTAFAGVFGKLTVPMQALLLDALADRGDSAALPAAQEGAKSQDLGVRVAALEAMGRLGGAACVPELASVAATGGSKEEKAAAQESLDILRGKDVDAAIVDYMRKCDAAQRAELARSLGARNAVSAVPPLIGAAKDADVNVRKEVFKALAVLGTEKDIPSLVDLLLGVDEDQVRKEAQKAVAQAAKTIGDANKRGAAIIPALDKAQKTEAQCAVLAVLGEIGDPNGLPPLRAAIEKGDDTLRDAAVRAIAGWPTPDAIDDLLKIAESAKDDTHRALAARGLFRLLEAQAERPAAEKVPYYGKAMAAARTPDDKKLVLAALAKVIDRGALLLVDPCLDDENLKAEAELAANSIKAGLFTAKASVNEANVKNAFDGNKDSRWDSTAAQKGGEWFQIDLGAEYSVSKVVLDVGGTQDFPRAYEVFVSSDGTNWGDPVAKGKGAAPATEASFNAKTGRFVKIVQTGSDATNWWGINEVRIGTREIKK